MKIRRTLKQKHGLKQTTLFKVKTMLNILRSFVISMLLISASQAAEQAFTQANFDSLQKQGLPILVSIHADWCPTCRAQAPVISKLLKQAEYQQINALQVNFDEQKAIVQAFKANQQSTLIVFKGGKEVGRSLGDTSESAIASLLKKAL